MIQLLFLVILFCSNIIQTMTGFAGNLLAMPVSMSLVGYQEARVVINVFTIEACFLIAYQERSHIQWKLLLKCSVLLLLGMAFAEIFLVHYHFQLIKKSYGLLIIFIAVSKLLVHRHFDYPPVLNILILFFAGVVHGLFLSGGAVLVIYLMRCDLKVPEFRSTLASIWVLLGLILCVSQGMSHLYTSLDLHLCALAIIPAVASYIVGHKLIHFVKGYGFYILTDLLLLASGISSFVL
jgi:uncharacterized membrane protein YfcA